MTNQPDWRGLKYFKALLALEFVAVLSGFLWILVMTTSGRLPLGPLLGGEFFAAIGREILLTNAIAALIVLVYLTGRRWKYIYALCFAIYVSAMTQFARIVAVPGTNRDGPLESAIQLLAGVAILTLLLAWLGPYFRKSLSQINPNCKPV